MKYIKFGLILGAVLSVLIFLFNVVFPDNSPDWAPGELMVTAIIGLFIIWSVYISRGTFKDKLLVGALTSLIGFVISMAMFFIIDNLYLSIVSRQSDKILAFAGSHGVSMQTFINEGLLRGLVIGIPASIIFGLVCGWIALHIPPKSRISVTHKKTSSL